MALLLKFALVGLAASSPVLEQPTVEETIQVAFENAAPEIRTVENAAPEIRTVPGDEGTELQGEMASLIMPIVNVTGETNGSCTDPFPVDIFNTTIRGDGGFNKLMLVIIEGTGLGIVGGDRLYLGQPFTAAAKAMTLGGLGVWAFLDYMNVMSNAIFLSEDAPLTFKPQAWRVRDGHVTFATYWTDCNMLFSRVAALIFMVLGLMVFCQLAKTCFTMTLGALKSGFSKVPSMG